MKANPEELRLLRYLSRGDAEASPAADGRLMVEAGERGAIVVSGATILSMRRQGLLADRDGLLSLAAAGRHSLGDGKAMSADQNRAIEVAVVEMPGGKAAAAINLAESPLALLMRRRGRDGAAFLTAAEFEAGERLRGDYTRGQIMPRLSANWVASVSSGRRDGGIADLTDAALGARLRVEKAIAAVGPELAGVLVDVCCFLKGMETVEMERCWPVRSAKIVLKTALGVLARHYNPAAPARQRRTLHWGADDYRPNISG